MLFIYKIKHDFQHSSLVRWTLFHPPNLIADEVYLKWKQWLNPAMFFNIEQYVHLDSPVFSIYFLTFFSLLASIVSAQDTWTHRIDRTAFTTECFFHGKVNKTCQSIHVGFLI